jgi:hypothetical protein
MKSEAFLHGLRRSAFASANLRQRLRNQWESIGQQFRKWRLVEISALIGLYNMPESWDIKSKLKLMDLKIKLGRKYWTIKPPMDVSDPFVRPWLVQFSSSDQGVDFFRDADGNGFLMSSEKSPGEFLFESADTALNAYYHRKIQLNEAKIFELLEENKIFYTMIKSII